MPPTRLLAALLVVALPGCDQVDRLRGERAPAEPAAAAPRDAPPLSLGLHTPGSVRHGDEGLVRLTVVNRGDTIARGIRVELLVPEWMEPMPPRPGDPEVTLVATDEGQTRFTYRMEDSLGRGQTRVVEQRIRVAPAPAQGTMTWSRVVRARLLGASGQPLSEVESEVGLQGAAAPPGDTARVTPSPLGGPPAADTSRTGAAERPAAGTPPAGEPKTPPR
jgi:hypothetical protein